MGDWRQNLENENLMGHAWSLVLSHNRETTRTCHLFGIESPALSMMCMLSADSSFNSSVYWPECAIRASSLRYVPLSSPWSHLPSRCGLPRISLVRMPMWKVYVLRPSGTFWWNTVSAYWFLNAQSYMSVLWSFALQVAVEWTENLIPFGALSPKIRRQIHGLLRKCWRKECRFGTVKYSGYCVKFGRLFLRPSARTTLLLNGLVLPC